MHSYINSILAIQVYMHILNHFSSILMLTFGWGWEWGRGSVQYYLCMFMWKGWGGLPINLELITTEGAASWPTRGTNIHRRCSELTVILGRLSDDSKREGGHVDERHVRCRVASSPGSPAGQGEGHQVPPLPWWPPGVPDAAALRGLLLLLLPADRQQSGSFFPLPRPGWPHSQERDQVGAGQFYCCCFTRARLALVDFLRKGKQKTSWQGEIKNH